MAKSHQEVDRITFYCDSKSSSYYHRGVLISVGTQLRVLDDRVKAEINNHLIKIDNKIR